jgi:hypothetical protein
MSSLVQRDRLTAVGIAGLTEHVDGALPKSTRLPEKMS